jgi:energy-converting hydrogenase Eha subunit E
MKKQAKFYGAWIAMYTICLVFGFLPPKNDLMLVVEIGLSLGFFIPPALLLRYAIATGRKNTVRYLRNISLASLGVTLVFLVLNFLSVYFTTDVGTALYYLLIFVSVPMVCAQQWFLSLFGWPCLLTVCRQEMKKK